MSKTVDFILESTIDEGLVRYRMAHTHADNLARIKVGIQLINNILEGSLSNSVVPPIKTGRLRGSGSVFFGAKNIYVTPKVDGEGEPNLSHSGKKGVITVGFNTPYAARMHENLEPVGEFKLGDRSKHSGNVGGEFVKIHLQKDGKELMKIYAKFLKAETK